MPIAPGGQVLLALRKTQDGPKTVANVGEQKVETVKTAQARWRRSPIPFLHVGTARTHHFLPFLLGRVASEQVRSGARRDAAGVAAGRLADDGLYGSAHLDGVGILSA